LIIIIIIIIIITILHSVIFFYSLGTEYRGQKIIITIRMRDNKRPDGTTLFSLLPWARGKPMAWDVTVPDTFAESHMATQ